MKVVDAPIVTLRFTVIALAAVKLTLLPAPIAVERSPVIRSGVAGKVFVAPPEELSKVRLP